MKRLLIILILTFSFQNLVEADDIRNIEIENMSIGDSILDFFTKKEIKRNTVDWYNDNEYTTIEIIKNLDKYDSLQISFLTKDSKKTITALDGLVSYKYKIEECYKKLDEVYKKIKSIVPNLNDEGKLTYKHNGDETGESTITDYVLETNKNDEIQIACYDYSKNFSNNNDNLRVGIRLIDFRNFLRNEAYK